MLTSGGDREAPELMSFAVVRVVHQHSAAALDIEDAAVGRDREFHRVEERRGKRDLAATPRRAQAPPSPSRRAGCPAQRNVGSRTPPASRPRRPRVPVRTQSQRRASLSPCCPQLSILTEIGASTHDRGRFRTTSRPRKPEGSAPANPQTGASLRATLAIGFVALTITAALFASAFNDGGSELDEGILVAYPTLVQDGDVPGRDFETFYGPGLPYLVAAAFAGLGPDVSVERAIALSFRLLVVGAVFALVLYWGTIPALVGSIAAALLMRPMGVAISSSWYGALALALIGLALATHAQSAETLGQKRRLALVAGVVSGLALIFRPDIAPAAIIPAAVLLVGGAGLGRFGIGFVLGALPTLVWVVVVGPDGVDRLLSDISAARPGRALPNSFARHGGRTGTDRYWRCYCCAVGDRGDSPAIQ